MPAPPRLAGHRAVITPQQLSDYVAALEAQGTSINALAAHLGRDRDTLVGWMTGTAAIPRAVQQLVAARAVQLEGSELVTRTALPKRGRPFG